MPEINPTVNENAVVLYPEPCPAPADFTINGCEDAVTVQIPDTMLRSLGRIVQVDVTLKQICPGKRVAVSVVLMETAADGTSTPRGVKHILVPAQEGTVCQDLTLRCIPFSLPEALDPSATPDSICNARTFTTQVFANYVDTDFVCCAENTVTV